MLNDAPVVLPEPPPLPETAPPEAAPQDYRPKAPPPPPPATPLPVIWHNRLGADETPLWWASAQPPASSPGVVPGLVFGLFIVIGFQIAREARGIPMVIAVVLIVYFARKLFRTYARPKAGPPRHYLLTDHRAAIATPQPDGEVTVESWRIADLTGLRVQGGDVFFSDRSGGRTGGFFGLRDAPVVAALIRQIAAART